MPSTELTSTMSDGVASTVTMEFVPNYQPKLDDSSTGASLIAYVAWGMNDGVHSAQCMCKGPQTPDCARRTHCDRCDHVFHT